MDNNEIITLRVKVDKNIDEVLKRILNSKKLTVQSLLETLINDYILRNINIVLGDKK